MEMRLSVKDLLRKIEYFLSARKKMLVQEGESFKEEYKQVGKPLANEEGINNLLHMVSMRVDSHVVQGNFEPEHYWEFIARARKELVNAIVINCYDWAIDDNKIEMIVDTIMSFIEPYLSRTIDNEERKSYMNQFQTKETISQGNQRQGLGVFKQ